MYWKYFLSPTKGPAISKEMWNIIDRGIPPTMQQRTGASLPVPVRNQIFFAANVFCSRSCVGRACVVARLCAVASVDDTPLKCLLWDNRPRSSHKPYPDGGRHLGAERTRRAYQHVKGIEKHHAFKQASKPSACVPRTHALDAASSAKLCNNIFHYGNQ